MKMFLRIVEDELDTGIPVHDTIARVLSRISTNGLQVCFTQWVSSVHQATAGKVVVIDGKSLGADESMNGTKILRFWTEIPRDRVIDNSPPQRYFSEIEILNNIYGQRYFIDHRLGGDWLRI